MKRPICVFLVLILTVCLAACSKKDETSLGNPEVEGAAFGVDLMKEGVQPMSEELASVETLRKTAEEYLEGITLFRNEDSRGRTYADLKAYIGVDATEYQYKSGFGQRVYTWRASDSAEAYLRITFSEINGQWVLLNAASAKLTVNQ